MGHPLRYFPRHQTSYLQCWGPPDIQNTKYCCGIFRAEVHCNEGNEYFETSRISWANNCRRSSDYRTILIIYVAI